MPVPSFKESAKFLDYKRLGKQRAEIKQLWEALVTCEPKRIYNHPACKMWYGYNDALLLYGIAICEEWSSRNYRDSLWLQFTDWLEEKNSANVKIPPWLGSPRLHRSHRGNLIRKNSTFYLEYGWTESPTLEYFWPSANYDWRKFEC